MEFIKLLVELNQTPVPTILAIGGLLLLTVSLIEISAKEIKFIPRVHPGVLSAIAFLLLIVSSILFIAPALAVNPPPSATPTDIAEEPPQQEPEVPSEEPTPTVALVESSRAISFDDNFEADEFNPEKWAIPATNPECIIQLADGKARFSNEISNDTLICLLSSLGSSKIPFEDLSYAEVDIFAVGDSYGPRSNQMIDFFTEDVEGGYWFAQCGLTFENNEYRTFFNIANWGRDQESEASQSIDASKETWYRLRMEVDPQTVTFRCFVDDLLIGIHVPSDADQLRKANFNRSLISYREPNSFGTFLVDNAEFGP